MRLDTGARYRADRLSRIAGHPTPNVRLGGSVRARAEHDHADHSSALSRLHCRFADRATKAGLPPFRRCDCPRLIVLMEVRSTSSLPTVAASPNGIEGIIASGKLILRALRRDRRYEVLVWSRDHFPWGPPALRRGGPNARGGRVSDRRTRIEHRSRLSSRAECIVPVIGAERRPGERRTPTPRPVRERRPVTTPGRVRDRRSEGG